MYMSVTSVRKIRSSFLRPFVPPPTWRLPPLSVSHRCWEIIIIIIRPSEMFRDGKVLEGTVSMPFSVQVLCKETLFQSSSFKRHHIHPSCLLLPHNSCKSTYFSKTTFEPKYAQVDFIRQDYTKASYYHRARQSILSNGGFGVFIFFPLFRNLISSAVPI